jgi:hypothetical protein
MSFRVSGSSPCWLTGPEVCSSPWAVRSVPVSPVMAMVTGIGPVRSTSPCTVIWPLASEKVPTHWSVSAAGGRSGQALAGTAGSQTPVPDWQIEALKVRYDLKLLGE